MAVRFRLANLADSGDAERVASLVALFEENQSGSAAPESGDLVEKLRAFPTTRCYLCEVHDAEAAEVEGGGAPVAAGMALCFMGFSTFQRKTLLNLHDFFILDAYRGRGLGRAFLAFLEAEARSQGWGRLTLEVYEDNASALALYQSCGFSGSRRGEERVSYFLQKNLV